jgi:hypothetical protein
MSDISRHRVALLGIGAVLVALCAVSADLAAQQPAEGRRQEVPEWARTRSDPEYPASEYLLGLGIASLEGTPTDALEQAAARSRADIAKQIRTRVEQILRDSLREERLEAAISLSRISGEVTVQTLEETRLQLEGVEIVRQWIGPSSVYVLSALDRHLAAERARTRISELEGRIQGDIGEMEEVLRSDPLEAVSLLATTEERVDAVVMQYEILSGVTRGLHLPPVWLNELEGLKARVHSSVDAAILIRETVAGQVPMTRTTYPAIAAFLVELGWTVRKLEEEAWQSATVEELSRRLAGEGIRYLLLIDAEAKQTESVRAGPAMMYFSRAGGALELIDLADEAVLYRVSYSFPSETKVAHRNAEAARRSSIEKLYDLMLGDLRVHLRVPETQGGRS